MADEITIGRKGTTISIEITGCELFTNYMESNIQSLAELSRGPVETKSGRRDNTPYLKISLEKTAIPPRKYRKVVTAWYNKHREAYQAVAWEIHTKARLLRGRNKGLAMAVHSPPHGNGDR